MAVEKVKIIVIEPDPRSLKELETKLSENYQVIATHRTEAALTMLRAEPEAKAIVVATYKGFDVLGLFEAVRHDHPQVLRILITAFEDLSQIVEGLHRGVIHRVLSKPLEYADLLGTVPAAQHSVPNITAHT